MSDTAFQSYPPHLLAGDMTYWLRIDAASFATLADLLADPTYGDGSGWSPAFSSSTYVTLGDGSKAVWDGSNWYVVPAPFVQPPPSPPPVPTSSNTKAQIVEWLAANGVDVDAAAQSQLTKDELLQIVEHVLNDDVDDPLDAVLGAT